MCPSLSPENLARFRRLYFALAKQYSHSALLDSCGWAAPTGGFYAMAFEATQTIHLTQNTLFENDRPIATIHTADALWQQLQERFPKPDVIADTDWPFQAGWIGVLRYELGALLESALQIQYRNASDDPLAIWCQFKHLVLWCPENLRWQVISPDPAFKAQAQTFCTDPSASPPHAGGVRGGGQPNTEQNHSDSMFSELVDEPLPLPLPQGEGGRMRLEASLSQTEFEQRSQTLQAAIEAGEIYQANLSMRYQMPDIPKDSLAFIYSQLVERNPSPFSGVFQTPQVTILSNSPERLVKYTVATRKLETRPIAGTRGRAQSAEQEAQINSVLQTDPKEQAEHKMLVDLARNDLGRIATPGSVKVTEMGILEKYAHVTHLVSQVEGELAEGNTVWEILSALFPCGTITGCPKIRCMQLLSEIEPVPRGYYTGALGYWDSRGDMDLNILIRSVFYQAHSNASGTLSFHAGAGIVADSQSAWEYRECLRKAQAIMGVLT